MIKLTNFSKKDIFPLSLILLMVFSRLLPHPPNFTPIIAVAILSGYFFKNIFMSFFVLLFTMLASDLFIGFYKNMIFLFVINNYCFYF